MNTSRNQLAEPTKQLEVCIFLLLAIRLSKATPEESCAGIVEGTWAARSSSFTPSPFQLLALTIASPSLYSQETVGMQI
jgi:hypothetical protein